MGTGARGVRRAGIEARPAGHRGRFARGAGRWGASPRARGALMSAPAGICLCLALAGCAGGGTGASAPTATAGGSGGAGGTPAISQATQAGPTATPFGFGTPSAVQGTTDACAQTTAAPTASLPGDIPAYPGAQVRIGSINGSSGVFGLCASDSVDTVDSYYAAHLPPQGWQQVTNNMLQSSRQLTASQGKTNLIVTISPDTALPGKTEVLIIYSGS
jgi:hypothetical protein